MPAQFSRYGRSRNRRPRLIPRQSQAAPAPAGPPPAAANPAPTPAAAAPAPAPAPASVAAAAPPSGPYYLVTYFNVAPKATRKAMAMLRQFAAATRKEDGNTELTVLHELNRPGHFAIVEAWKDKAAADAHGAAMKAFGDKLQPIVTAPFSARPFVIVDVAPPAADANLAGAIWVLTHIDVFPQGKDEVAGMVKQLVADSRKDPGVQRFDALVWDGHTNHFHLIEAWADRKSLEAHATADHTRRFAPSSCRSKAGSTTSGSTRRSKRANRLFPLPLAGEGFS